MIQPAPSRSASTDSRSSPPRLRTVIAATAAVCLYPLIELLARFDYGYLAPEALLAALLLATPPVVLMIVVWRWAPRMTGPVLALFALISMVARANLLIPGVLLTTMVLLMALRLLRARFTLVAAVAFATMGIVAMVENAMLEPTDPADWRYSSGLDARPSVIHLVLDAQMGTGGLPDHPRSAPLREAMEQLFADFGFEHYPYAYTRYQATVNSLDHAMGFRSDASSSLAKSHFIDGSGDLSDTAYFDVMEAAGYAIHVFHSEGYSFCGEQSDRGNCYVYKVPDLNALHASRRSTWEKSRGLLKMVGRRSLVMAAGLTALETKAAGISMFHPPSLTEPFAQFRRAPRGQLFFSHVLLPHDPYVFDADCRLSMDRPVFDVIERTTQSERNTPETRQVRYGHYLDQSLCGVRLLREQLQSLSRAGLLEKATILLHGDHGSHISLASLTGRKESVTPRDLADNYSVLFAVRYPSGEYRRDERHLPLEYLLAETTAKMTGRDIPMPDPTPYVYIGHITGLMRAEIDVFELLRDRSPGAD